jgi:hypothetical protein
VIELANNHLAGSEAVYLWKGDDASGMVVAPGFYVIHLEVFFPARKRSLRKRLVAGVSPG